VARHVPASVTELSRIGLLASLPGETLTRLAARMRREEVPPGRAIVTEGEEDGRFYALLSGMAAVAQSSLGPRRLLRPGDTFGEVSATMGIPRTATVTTITQCVVASCDRDTFSELLRPLFADDE
jgi:CRP/FNR family cyclic AMP-dependent transcriptional regulator